MKKYTVKELKAEFEKMRIVDMERPATHQQMKKSQHS